MKIIDERGNKKNKKKSRQKIPSKVGRGGGAGRSYSERIRAKWFCCAFNLGYLKLNVKLF